MPDRKPFEYVIVRVVPSVERGECLNAGVALICRPARFLQARVMLDRDRLRGLAPWIDDATVEDLECQLELIPRIAAGEPGAGPIAALEMGERWHWLAAPASTMIQPSDVHTGLCSDPAHELDQLFQRLVSPHEPD